MVSPANTKKILRIGLSSFLTIYNLRVSLILSQIYIFILSNDTSTVKYSKFLREVTKITEPNIGLCVLRFSFADSSVNKGVTK